MQETTRPRPINLWLYLGIPLATVVALLLSEWTSLDMDVANLAFDPVAGAFIGRHSYFLENILHDRVIFLTMQTEGVPHVAPDKRREVEELGSGLYRIVVRYGFMDEIDIPAELLHEDRAGGAFKSMETSYFLSRQTLIASRRPGMALWRENLFAGMVRNAESAMEFFKLPSNRVIELGSQVEI